LVRGQVRESGVRETEPGKIISDPQVDEVRALFQKVGERVDELVMWF